MRRWVGGNGALWGVSVSVLVCGNFQPPESEENAIPWSIKGRRERKKKKKSREKRRRGHGGGGEVEETAQKR